MEDLLNIPAKKLNLNNLVSLNLERHVLSALLKQPQIFPEIDTFLTDADFYNKVHQTVFCVIRNSYLKNEKLDKVLLAQKIKNLNINFFEEVDIFDYIENLFFSNINEKAGIESCKELIKLRIRREICETADRVKEFVVKNGEQRIDELLSETDRIYNEKVTSYFHNVNEPVDIFKDLESDIEKLGNEPKEDGIVVHFNSFRELFGNFTSGSLSMFCARAKSGKSTILNNLLFGACTNPNQKVKGLIIDTEMDTRMVQRRMLSSITEINEYFLRTGKFRQNLEMTQKVREAWKFVKLHNGLIDHIYVGSADIDYVISIMRRWYRKNIPRDDSILGILCYDYIKLTSELGDYKYKSYKDYQIVAQKIDKLKRLSLELDCPIISAGQTNRMNEQRKSGYLRTDTGAAVGLSDQINALSDRVFLYNKLALDELAEAKSEYGINATHALIPLYLRIMGEKGPNKELVKFRIDKDKYTWRDNFVYYNVQNFKVTELGCLYDLEEKKKDKFDITEDNHDDSDIL